MNYLLRYQRRGDHEWQHKLVYDATEAVISPARIGTYDFELYAIASNGQPSDPIVAEYDFQPDRDFEDTSVFNLRLLNHALVASQEALDPLLEFTGPDILIAWTEPDFSGEYTGEETADINTGLDPLVKGFEIQVFDPETGTVLRTERDFTSREYRYTRSMNADDQAATLGRGPYRQVGFRVRMYSVTNRISAWQMITVANPRPTPPDGMVLSSTPGNSAQSLAAMVHVDVLVGASKSDADFSYYAVWASETFGFTPSPSNFKGVTSANSFSFPASSGVNIYVVAGALDEFHAVPELISSPSTDVNLLSEQVVATIDGAVFPVDTEDITAKAVTDAFSDSGPSTRLSETVGVYTEIISLNAIPSGGIVATNASTVLQRGSRVIRDVDLRLVRRGKFSGVFLWDQSANGGAGAFIDHTTAAFNVNAGDVTLNGATNDYLYIGSVIPFGDYSNAVYFLLSTGDNGPLGLEVTYWNGAWSDVSSLNDFTFGFSSSGMVRWLMPVDWIQSTVNGLTCYWIRIRRTGTPSPVAVASRIFLQTFLDQVIVPETASQELVTIGLGGTIDPTTIFEEVALIGYNGSPTPGTGTYAIQSTMNLIVGKR